MRLKLWKQVNLSLLLPVLIASAVILYAAYNLGTISGRINFIEIADDINLTLLELRRYEKNIILFKEEENVKKFNEYLGQLDAKLRAAEKEIIDEINRQNYRPLLENIGTYKKSADQLIACLKKEYALLEDIRPLGRGIEKEAQRKDMAFELRRHEKNYIIYREQSAVERVNRTAKDLVRVQPELTIAVMSYLKVFDSLVKNETLKDDVVEKMRHTGREIEKVTIEFSTKKRDAIGHTISTSKTLLFVSFIFLLMATSAVAFLFSSNVVNTFKTIEKTFQRLKAGDFTHGIELEAGNAPAEIRSFVNAYNQTIEDLGRSKQELENTLRKLEDTNRELVDKQDTLVEARKLTAMRLLASEIAHEINNPLSSVTTFLGMFCEDMQADPGKKESLEIMLKEVNRCQAVLRELVDFARKEPLRLREVDPARLLKDAIKVAGKQHERSGINFIAFMGELPGKVVIDPILIHQVIVNILGNAYHFSKQGDTIEIEGYSVCNDMIIEVKDSGIGIAEQNLPYIFEPFFSTRTENGGSGLGLAIAKKIIERHNGNIQVESRVGEGTVFKITLPVDQENSC